jgi:hypothetical protein
MYCAFFARRWKGPVELRGLEDRDYSVVDYVTGKASGRCLDIAHICRLSSMEICF